MPDLAKHERVPFFREAAKLNLVSQEYVTRPSLLLRVRDPEDDASWREFVEIYGPLIQRFAMSRGATRDNAPDITQDVLRNVAKAMHAFEYDPEKGTFRSWLFTIIRRETIRVAKKQKRPGGANTEDPSDLLNQVASPEEGTLWETDYQRQLLRWAMGKIEHEFTEGAWMAFKRMALEDCTAEEVSKELSMAKGTVYVYKSRVLKRLLERVRSIDNADWEADMIQTARPKD